MKKYYNFINEETITVQQTSKILDKIFEECKPYIDLMKSCDGQRLLFRGFRDEITIKEIKHRWNRTPIDTPQEIHDFLNDKFNKKFGWNARSGVFCYLKEIKNVTTGYGNPYILFPIGDFKYLWSNKVHDLYSDHEIEMNDYLEYTKYTDEKIDNDWKNFCHTHNCDINNKEKFNKFINKLDKKYITDFLNYLEVLVDTYKNTDICNANETKEILINCDSYYLIDIFYIDLIKKMIWGKEKKPTI